MAKRRKHPSSITLPWERRNRFTQPSLGGRRGRNVILAVVTCFALLWVARSAESREHARETRTSSAEIQRGITAFRADFGRCPHNLHELTHPPRGSRRYLREIPLDGWGRSFFVQCPGRYDPDGTDVFSAGPSGNFLIDDNLQ